MDIADETGMLILSEGFDMWERSKTDYDYARFFDEWVEKDVASWVRRDRNRPSIIGWSVGNDKFHGSEQQKPFRFRISSSQGERRGVPHKVFHRSYSLQA